MFEEYILLLKL